MCIVFLFFFYSSTVTSSVLTSIALCVSFSRDNRLLVVRRYCPLRCSGHQSDLPHASCFQVMAAQLMLAVFAQDAGSGDPPPVAPPLPPSLPPSPPPPSPSPWPPPINPWEMDPETMQNFNYTYYAVVITLMTCVVIPFVYVICGGDRIRAWCNEKYYTDARQERIDAAKDRKRAKGGGAFGSVI